MPLDQIVGPDIGDLYSAAMRALKYCEPLSEHSGRAPNAFVNMCRSPFQQKHFQLRAGFYGWFRRLLRCA